MFNDDLVDLGQGVGLIGMQQVARMIESINRLAAGNSPAYWPTVAGSDLRAPGIMLGAFSNAGRPAD